MILSRTMPTYSLLLSKWWCSRIRFEMGRILLSMTKIQPDDILEVLYKLRTRESEKLKTVLELYDLEIHQKKLGPDYHRSKAMVERSIEQEIRNKNFGARIWNFEKNAVFKNQGTKQRGQRILGDCWQWENNGQCVKGDICSFRHDMNKRGKVTPSNPFPNMQQNERKSSRTRSPRGKCPSGRTSRWPCKDYFGRTASSRVHVEQDQEWMQIWVKVLLRASRGWWRAQQKNSKEWWQQCNDHMEDYATIGLRISRNDAAEVHSPEEHRHADTNSTREIHKGYCASHWNSKPKSFALIDLPRRTSSA